MKFRWQDIEVGSIWREKHRRHERLIKVCRVDSRELVIRTVVLRTAFSPTSFQPKFGSRASTISADRFGSDFEPLTPSPAEAVQA